ncbi:hypothetical protein [Pontibacter rugosus]|uniref:Uncharacterized protein n=1 Tax=Pontibacter rugosus TaxID=1745966 RepID=A0ABW3SLU1_9BACT
MSAAEKTVRQLCQEIIALAGYLKNNPADSKAIELLCSTTDQIKTTSPSEKTQETKVEICLA